MQLAFRQRALVTRDQWHPTTTREIAQIIAEWNLRSFESG